MSAQQSKGQGWEHSVAGAVAGTAAVLLLHPFDVIKTRMQVQDGHQLVGNYQGFMDAVRKIIRQEGWRAFYNGLAPALIGSGVAWSAYFTAYEAIKAFHGRHLKEGERLPTLGNTASAAQAGAMVCLVTNPIWLVKTRLQLQRTISASPQPPPTAGRPTTMQSFTSSLEGTMPGSASTSAGSVNAAGQTSSTPGQGQPPPDVKQTSRPPGSSAGAPPGTPPPHGSAPSQSQATPHGPAGNASSKAGGQSVTNGTASAASKSIHVGRAQSKQYRGFLDALVRIGREEGAKAYFKGLGPSLVLQTGHGAIQFTVYEELKHLISSFKPAANPDGSPADQRLSSLETSMAAMMSKLSASILTYPTQVVRSRLQQRFDLDRTLKYNSTWEVISLTWQREGPRGFYKGLGPALMRTLPQSALTMVVYENVVHLLQASSGALR